jgi:coproporphyrinogen III oxidase-like Fe-S oxidoreductase
MDQLANMHREAVSDHNHQISAANIRNGAVPARDHSRHVWKQSELWIRQTYYKHLEISHIVTNNEEFLNQNFELSV